MESKNLGKQLSYLASANTNQSDFNNPFEDTPIVSSVVIESSIKSVKEKKEKKKKGDKFTRFIEKSEKLIEDICDDDTIFDFDNYLGMYFSNDEDVSFRNSLISMGRKYNRDSSTSAEASEFVKAFSGNEKALNALLDEISRDKAALQKDIEYMRMSRVKNYKNLAELLAVKNQLYNSSLQIIKESTGIKKTQFDLQNKANAKKAAEGNDDSSASSKAISSLFGIGRSNILGSVGGYEYISGAPSENNNSSTDATMTSVMYTDDDEIIQQRYFSENKNNEESDGDKFLKYENRGVQYILLINPDNSKTILAEDKEGNIIPDYPMPSNAETLTFEISNNSATDDLHRPYKVRYVGDENLNDVE